MSKQIGIRVLLVAILAGTIFAAPRAWAGVDGCRETNDRRGRTSGSAGPRTLKDRHINIFRLGVAKLNSVLKADDVINDVLRQNPYAKFETVFDAIRDARNAAADDFREWARSFANDPLLGEVLEVTAARIEIRKGKEGFAQKDFRESMSYRDCCPGQRFTNTGAQAEALRNLGRDVQGEIGEFIAAMETPRLKRRSVYVSELEGAARVNPPSLRNKEIDIIYTDDAGREVWREVKNLSSVLSASDRGQLAKIEPQLQATLKVVEQLGRNIVIELYFINGIAPELKAEIEAKYHVLVTERNPS